MEYEYNFTENTRDNFAENQLAPPLTPRPPVPKKINKKQILDTDDISTLRRTSSSSEKSKESDKQNECDDLWSLVTWIAKNLNFKLGAMLLILLIFILSDFFEDTFLKPWGVMSGEQPTSYGSFIQYLIIALMAIIIDFAIKTEIL